MRSEHGNTRSKHGDCRAVTLNTSPELPAATPSNRSCRVAIDWGAYVGISEVCTRRTKRFRSPNEADFGRVRLSSTWTDCVPEQRTTWKSSEGFSSVPLCNTYDTIRQRGPDTFTGGPAHGGGERVAPNTAPCPVTAVALPAGDGERWVQRGRHWEELL